MSGEFRVYLPQLPQGYFLKHWEWKDKPSSVFTLFAALFHFPPIFKEIYMIMAVLVSHQGEPLLRWTWMAKQARKWFLGYLCRAKDLTILVGPFQLRTFHIKQPNHTTPKLSSGCNPKCYDFQSIYSLLPKIEPQKLKFLPYLHLRPKLFFKGFSLGFKGNRCKAVLWNKEECSRDCLSLMIPSADVPSLAWRTLC